MTRIIEHVIIDPKYIKAGTAVVICNPGSQFNNMTGTIVGMAVGQVRGFYVNVSIDEEYRKPNNLPDKPVPFLRRELCVQDSPIEGDEDDNILEVGTYEPAL